MKVTVSLPANMWVWSSQSLAFTSKRRSGAEKRRKTKYQQSIHSRTKKNLWVTFTQKVHGLPKCTRERRALIETLLNSHEEEKAEMELLQRDETKDKRHKANSKSRLDQIRSDQIRSD